jgi:hypothetical protein
MGQPVDANGRSILHKGHGMTHTCAVPDVCKTPSPGGPIPIPYVNVAMDSNLTDGADSVKIEGNPLANVSSKIATSVGDEPGTAGGIISSKFKGTVTWKMGSLDVKAEGKSVVRFLDNALHNGNSFNSAFINVGQTGFAYADDFTQKCEICQHEAPEHRIFATRNAAKLCAELIEALKKALQDAPDDKKAEYAHPDGAGGFRGYMVGVMVCDKDESFAAMSGPGTLPGFEKVARDTCGHTPVSGGIVQPAEFAGANQATANAAGAALTPAFKRTEVDAAIRRINQKRGNGYKGYNIPGNCAGAKLLARAPAASHKPVAMTEAFFLGWAGKYTYLETHRTEEQLASYSRSWINKLKRGKQAKRSNEARDFTDASPVVVSCHSCQELLYLTMCPERNCP